MSEDVKTKEGVSEAVAEKKEATEDPKAEVLSFFKTLGIFLIVAMSVRTIVVEPFKIPSGSMIPTLQIGDYILVSKWDFGLHIPFFPHAFAEWNSPKREDIVVFTRPDNPETPYNDESSVNIIKRVVAVAGDTIEVKADKVYLNGEVLQEQRYQTRWLDGGQKDFGPSVVPEGHVFLMGDNRDRSKDSRFWKPSPFLPVNRVVGKARMIYWRWDTFSRIGTLLY